MNRFTIEEMQEMQRSLQEKYKDTVHFTEYDISIPENNLLFNQTAAQYGIPADKRGYPAAEVGSTYLMGYPTEIGTYSEAAIEKAHLLGEPTRVSTLSADQVQQSRIQDNLNIHRIFCLFLNLYAF